MAYYMQPCHQSIYVCVFPPKFARQELSTYVTVGRTNSCRHCPYAVFVVLKESGEIRPYQIFLLNITIPATHVSKVLPPGDSVGLCCETECL
jgi:hypothetical protein